MMVIPRSSTDNEILVADQQHEQEMIDVRNQIENTQNKQRTKSESSKRRKRWSKVWEDFTLSVDGSGKAVCNHCNKEFDGSSIKGTTHLKNHLERCRRKRNNGGEDHANESIKTSDLTASIVVFEEESVIDLIKHNIDAEGLTTKHYDPTELNSRKIDILQVYEEEKEKLRRYLNNLSCRFSLRIEWFWGWRLLMVQYIDDSWEPKTKIIGCLKYKSFDKDEILKANIEDVCLEWKIDTNICSLITFDFDDHEEIKIVGVLNNWFDKHGSLPRLSRLPSVLANFISEMFWICGAVKAVKRCLDYVHKSSSNEHMFQIAVGAAKSMGKKVPSQCLPKWIYPDVELEIAVGFKEAFYELEQIDPHFKSINLTKEQWDEATMTCQHLKGLNDIIQRSLVVGKYTTLNVYFSIFCDIYTKLLWWGRIQQFRVREKVSPVLKNFVDNFWSKYNLILAIAVVLDPRFKMDLV